MSNRNRLELKFPFIGEAKAEGLFGIIALVVVVAVIAVMTLH
jgi:hypothetical protein